MMQSANFLRRLIGLTLMLRLWSAHPALAEEQKSNSLTKSTHVYKTVEEVKIQADVYAPMGEEIRPVIVWIHGGALIVGSRTQVPRNVLELCTKERFILVSLDYRLAPEVKLPEIAADIQDAFRWLHEQGPKLFQADTSRIVVTGGSAGGYLTMLSGVIVKPRPRALVAYWGYGDIDGPWVVTKSPHHIVANPDDVPKNIPNPQRILTNTDDPVDQKRGLYYRSLRQAGTWAREVTGIDPSTQPGKLDRYCPVKQITADYPPILMVHGTEDTDVPYARSVEMAAELAKHKVPHELITVPKAEHSLRDGDPQVVAEAHSRALGFIKQHALTKPPQAALAADEVTDLLRVISRVGPEGQGSVEAKVARDALASRGIVILPPLLTAMDTQNVVALNWYRTIYQDVVSRARLQSNVEWPVEFLKTYVGDAKIAGRPRRLVLTLIDQLEPQFSERWKPSRLNDPEFRYEAVSLALAAGDRGLNAKDTEVAKREFRQAFENARDSGQVAQAASRLQALDEPADAVSHLGLVVDWWLVGPFDAPAKTGFTTPFEPESKVDLKAHYQGQGGSELGWNRYRSTDSLGQLNLIDAIASTREAVGYAYSEVDVAKAQPALIGCGADDNCTVWLNGEKVLAREQWLNGTRFDRFVAPIKLQAGRNSLLVKICQGPQHKDPEVPNNWSLQLRLCDHDGKGIAFKSALR